MTRRGKIRQASRLQLESTHVAHLGEVLAVSGGGGLFLNALNIKKGILFDVRGRSEGNSAQSKQPM